MTAPIRPERTAIIVTDAWRYWSVDLINCWPTINEEITRFCHWLDYCLCLERTRGKLIVHHANGIPTNREISILRNDRIVTSTEEIATDYDQYLFCGFHYGLCIHKKMQELSAKVDKSKIGVIVNLSLALHDYDLVKNNHWLLEYQNFYWTPSEILPVKLKFGNKYSI